MKRKSIVGMVIVMTFLFNFSSTSAQVIKYEYDALNRLIGVDSNKVGITSFKYDLAGNLLNVNLSGLRNPLVFEKEFLKKEIAEGWIPYATKGVIAEYSLSTEVIDQLKLPPEKDQEEEIEVREEIDEESKGSKEEETDLEERTGLEEEETELEIVEELEAIEEIDTNVKFEAGNEPDISENNDSDKEQEVKESTESKEEIEKEEIEAEEKFDKDDGAGTEILSDLVQQISIVASQPGGANIYKDFQVEAEQTHMINGWLKVGKLQNTAVQVIVNYYDKNDKFIHHKNIMNIQGSSDWVLVDSIVIPPINTTKARVHLQIVSSQGASSGIASFSEFSLSLMEDI